MPCDLYEVLWVFFVYAFVGWCTEVAYAGLNEGAFVNRGFLNGPYCPIYGFGVLIVIAVLTPVKDNLVLLFAGAFVLTTVLEYLTGLVLEKVFGNKWWDYSDLPFNIQGYICLKYSVFWGLGCMFIMHTVHPAVYRGILWIPREIGTILLAVFLLMFAADLIVTVNTVLKFNRKLRTLEKMTASLHKLSDEIGGEIFEGVAAAVEKRAEIEVELEEKRTRIGEKRAQLEEKRLRREELYKAYEEELRERFFGFRRLIRAFPGMTSKERDEILQKYKKYLDRKKKENG